MTTFICKHCGARQEPKNVNGNLVLFPCSCPASREAQEREDRIVRARSNQRVRRDRGGRRK